MGCWTFTEAGKCNKDLTSSLKASSKNSAIFHFWDSLLLFIFLQFKGVIGCKINFTSCLNINVLEVCVHIHPIMIKIHPVFFLKSGCSETTVRMM